MSKQNLIYLGVRISPQIKDKVEKAAQVNDCSESDIVRIALKNFFLKKSTINFYK